MDKIEFLYLFLFFLLFGLVIYSLVYFFQSFLDKSRIAIILSLLIYFLMFFLPLPIYSNAVSRVIKFIFCLLFPPITMQLGINTISNFQINFNPFKGRVFMKYNKFSFFDMYILFICNFFIYMFLGFYLQNVISHEFGIKKPFYFLFTKQFWGIDNNDYILKNKIEITNEKNGDKNINYNSTNNIKKFEKNKDKDLNSLESAQINKTKEINNILYEGKDIISSKEKLKNEEEKLKNNSLENDYFENEKKYEIYKVNDILQIKNIHKTFDDGKIALNDVSFNLYRNEIFALLGHNGAGKTTLINILTGLYQSTLGSAIFNSYNILSYEGIEKFRKILGVCPQHDVLFNDLTVEEHLEMFCVFKSVDNSEIKSEVARIIKVVELEKI